MTHTGPMPDSAGEFADWTPVQDSATHWHPRPTCDAPRIVERCWESSCGGYEDWQFVCLACGRRWWSEGADA